MTTASALVVDDLRVEYVSATRRVRAVDGISFSIAPGEVFGLAGESGCGKSTVANAIMRLLAPSARVTARSLQFEDRDLLDLEGEELRLFRWQEIAMVFQSAMNALNPVMTVGDQIVDVVQAHGRVSRADARERAGELFALVGIDSDRLTSYPHQLSGGMRQRCVIAIALALKPKLLIMDEPTTALDVVVQQDIMQQIAELQRSFGFSVLFITHDISLMIEMSDRMAVMYDGRLVELGAPLDLLENAQHPYTRALMGAFPPLSGPRTRLTGLADSGEKPMWARDIAPLEEIAPGHLMSPTEQKAVAR